MPSTTRYKRGDIVLVPFPFTDLSSSKRRPALVISPDSFNEQMQDVVVAAITSQLTDKQHALMIEQQDCVEGALPKTSLVKLAKVFTIHSTLIVKRLCALRGEKLAAVLDELRRFFSNAGAEENPSDSQS
jgi:mRNA interferase MazF